MPSDPHEVARGLANALRARPPTLGAGHLVCVDGPAGSGKTTLALALRDAMAPAPVQVVHTDEMLEGWPGLPALPDTIATLLGPLSAGNAGRWRRWDWHASGWAEWRAVEPGGLLVIEGVGSWSAAIAPVVTTLVWVEADADTRWRRGMERDGEGMRAEWQQWQRDEAAHFEAHRTRAHADLVVSTSP